MAFWKKLWKEKKEAAPLQEVEEKPEHNMEILECLESFHISGEELKLFEVHENAEIVHTYLKYLIRDMGEYLHTKTEKKKSTVEKRVAARIKMVTNHGLELKNLLGHLEQHYYEPLINIFCKVYELSHDKEVEEKMHDLEDELSEIRELVSLLNKIIGYEALFNPEKNHDFEKDIEEEVKKKDVNTELEELAKKIHRTVIDPKTGLKMKIDENLLERFKQKF